MKRILTSAAVIAACTLLVALIFTRADFSATPSPLPESLSTNLRMVQLGGQTVRVETVDTPEGRSRGLSGHPPLAEHEGMLFVFPEDGLYSFWMKDMSFSIDILWLSSDGVVVDMKKNVSPDTYPTVFEPAALARYVLELHAGFLERYNVEVGNIVRL